MILVDKCINHSIWLINAIKEHNKLVNQDITFKMTDKVFILNKSFQKYFYSFNVYQKLFAKFDKGFNFYGITIPYWFVGIGIIAIILTSFYNNQSSKR